MKLPGWKPTLLVGAGLPLAASLVLQTVKVVRALRLGRDIVSAASPFEQRPAEPSLRVLIMGDSTGLGVGAQAGQSLAALLAADRPDAEVLNVSRSGARLGDITHQLRQLPRSKERWDLVLLHAGGNDIFRGTSPARMRRDAEVLLSKLISLARHVVWLGPPNIGLLPAFVPPFSWLLSRRSVLACALFKQCADRFGVRFVDFCEPRDKAFFSADPERYIASDQVHPTEETYRHCYGLLKQSLPDLDLLRAAVDAASGGTLDIDLVETRQAGARPSGLTSDSVPDRNTLSEAGPPFAPAG
jgi:lysophospholipase L1-like esterase